MNGLINMLQVDGFGPMYKAVDKIFELSKNDFNKITIKEFNETLLRVQIMLQIYEILQHNEQPPDGILDFDEFYKS